MPHQAVKANNAAHLSPCKGEKERGFPMPNSVIRMLLISLRQCFYRKKSVLSVSQNMLLFCKRMCFGLQKTIFCSVKHHLLPFKRYAFEF